MRTHAELGGECQGLGVVTVTPSTRSRLIPPEPGAPLS